MMPTDTQIIDDLHEQVQVEAEAPVPEDAPKDAPWVPDTAEKVDWVLGKVADYRARAARIRENAEKMARQEEAEAEGLLWHYTPALQAFLHYQTDGTKRKSMRLFHGQLGFRTKAAAFTLSDPAEAQVWAEKHLPGCLRVDKRAMETKLAVNDQGEVVFTETGEVLSFAGAKPAEEVFFVK